MREELTVMKTAFEAKLKAARDEAEELSWKHMQAIRRMNYTNGTNVDITSSGSGGINNHNTGINSNYTGTGGGNTGITGTGGTGGGGGGAIIGRGATNGAPHFDAGSGSSYRGASSSRNNAAAQSRATTNTTTSSNTNNSYSDITSISVNGVWASTRSSGGTNSGGTRSGTTSPYKRGK
jgi:hypothetical protein